jgi:hypothetical protein
MPMQGPNIRLYTVASSRASPRMSPHQTSGVILQVEYATDIVFRSAADLAPLYDHLLRTAIHAVKVDDVATFLGRSPERIGDR